MIKAKIVFPKIVYRSRRVNGTRVNIPSQLQTRENGENEENVLGKNLYYIDMDYN